MRLVVPVAAPRDVGAAGVQLDRVDDGLEQRVGLEHVRKILIRDARDPRTGCRGRRASERAAASAPGFGSPIAFTIDARVGYRTMRGLGLPLRGRRVNVPHTT